MSNEEEKKQEIPQRMNRVAWPKAKYGLFLAIIIIILYLVISYKHLIF
jgi:cell division septal protein FtsQ